MKPITYPRPSRYHRNRTHDYCLTVSGLVYGRAVQALRGIHQTGSVENPLLETMDLASHQQAKRRLLICQNRMSAGDTAAERSC